VSGWAHGADNLIDVGLGDFVLAGAIRSNKQFNDVVL
jgi:hypothetical protein